MSRTQVQQVDLAAADLDGQVAVERLVGVAQLYAAEVEVPEAVSRVCRRDRAEIGGLRHGQHLGRHPVRDLVGRALGGDDPHRFVE